MNTFTDQSGVEGIDLFGTESEIKESPLSPIDYSKYQKSVIFSFGTNDLILTMVDPSIKCCGCNNF